MSVATMPHEEYLDFAEQLYWSVVEEAPLYDIPLGVVDLVGGQRVERGPWAGPDCSEALLVWFDAGLLELYRWRDRDRGPHLDVAHDEARRLLLDPARWRLDDPAAGDVCLVASEKGHPMDLEEWVGALSRLRHRT